MIVNRRRKSKQTQKKYLLCAPHFAQLFEKDEVPLLKLRRLLALRGPWEAEASCLVGHHVTLHQQLIVCNRTRRVNIICRSSYLMEAVLLFSYLV